MYKIIIIVLIVLIVVIGYALIRLPVSPKDHIQSSVVPTPTVVSNITVTSPLSGEKVGLPFIVRGEARVFENVVNVRLRTQEDETLFQGLTMANSPDVGQFGPFEAIIDYLLKKPTDPRAVLEVFWASPKDGSPLDTVSIPLNLALGDINTIKVFFNNNKLDPESSCNKVFSVERVIEGTQAPARTALEILLAGPNSEEYAQGFFTNINSGVKIQSLKIEKGVAFVDFDKRLDEQVGGSCRVAAIRAQIVQTLKQFPTVKKVIISIDGRTEDILQP